MRNLSGRLVVDIISIRLILAYYIQLGSKVCLMRVMLGFGVMLTELKVDLLNCGSSGLGESGCDLAGSCLSEIRAPLSAADLFRGSSQRILMIFDDETL